jgi:uncharacterized membrane protein
MDGIWIVYLFLAAFPGIIIFAIVYKYIEVSRAARWPSTPGCIVVSTSQVREVRSGGPDSDDTEPRNFARIVYEYTVGGRKLRHDRVSIGEDLGNFEVAETIARYPVGKMVTVYYNPRKYNEAVLERDLPPGIWKVATIGVLVIVVLIVGAIVGFRKLGELIAATIPNPATAPFVTACLGFALVAALMIFGIQRNVARMRAWPTVPGRIGSADVREFQALSESDAGSRRWVTRYRGSIVYSYEVAGVRYSGDQIGTTGRVSSSMSGLVRPNARYQPGKVVDIHYNPDNPAESILAPRSGPLWLLWLVPAAMLALAYVAAG